MNDSPYSLRLIATWKVVLLVFGGLVAIVIAFFGGVIYNNNHQLFGGTGDLVWGGVTFLGGGYGLYRFGKTWCASTVQIVVAPRGVAVFSEQQTEDIPYGSIRSYRYEAFNDGHSLRIKLLTGKTRSFNSGGRFITNEEAVVFVEMVRAFESAVSAYQQQQGSSASILREKTFFEKPIATVFLVICSLLIVATIVLMVVKRKFVAGSFISFLGLFIPFARGWYNVRRKKQEE